MTAARKDTRKKASFLSYRLNIPSADESTMLLTVPDWRGVLARKVPEREGPARCRGGPGAKPGVVNGGCNLAVWPDGSHCVDGWYPGHCRPREAGRGQPRGTYQFLADCHRLRAAHGLRVPPVKQLTDFIQDEWGKPAVVVCDRFKLAALQDAARGVRIEPRVSRWSESTEDITALRALAMDGPLSCETESGHLLTASLAAAMVENDTSGNSRPIKRGTNNKGRDDVAISYLLAAGEVHRRASKPKSEGIYHGLAG